MKKKFNLYLILGCSFFVVFLLLMILLCFVDKAGIGEFKDSEVGFSNFNSIVKYKYRKGFDISTDILLYTSFLIPLAICVMGVCELVKRKKLFAVDLDILIYGCGLVVMIIFWLLFSEITINLRPTTEREASFPSTHVLVFTFIALSGFDFIKNKFKTKNKISYTVLAFTILAILYMAIGRVSAGAHYITDSIGGVLLGVSLYFTTFGFVKLFVKPMDISNENLVKTE